MTTRGPLLRILPVVTQDWRTRGQAIAESVCDFFNYTSKKTQCKYQLERDGGQSHLWMKNLDFEATQSSYQSSSFIGKREKSLSTHCFH